MASALFVRKLLSTNDGPIKYKDQMNPQSSLPYETGVLRILQTKEQTRAYYNKIAKVYDLLSEEAEKPMRESGLGKLSAHPAETIL